MVDLVVVSILEIEVTYLDLGCREKLTTDKNTHNYLLLLTTDHHILRLKGGEEILISWLVWTIAGCECSIVQLQ